MREHAASPLRRTSEKIELVPEHLREIPEGYNSLSSFFTNPRTLVPSAAVVALASFMSIHNLPSSTTADMPQQPQTPMVETGPKDMNDLIKGLGLDKPLKVLGHQKQTINYASIKDRPLTAQERNCIVRNVVGEAADQEKSGQRAVIAVTLNRLIAPGYPKDACGIVYQPYQFSWTNDANSRNLVAHRTQLAEYAAVTEYAERIMGSATTIGELHAKLKVSTKLSTHTYFYKRTDDVGVSERSQKIFATFVKVGTVDEHTFYRPPSKKELKARVQALRTKATEQTTRDTPRPPKDIPNVRRT
jgi:Cell Wall Hydrolase